MLARERQWVGAMRHASAIVGAGVLALGGCAAVPAPIEANQPFVVEGIGPAPAFVYPAEIQKDLARRAGPSCAGGFDVIHLETRRNANRMGPNFIRYRAVVQCRPT